jgi:hypothetical protein
MKILLVLFISLFIATQANLGCSPALKNTDCPNSEVCTKILIGTTEVSKAKKKYFYQCLSVSLVASAGIFVF